MSVQESISDTETKTIIVTPKITNCVLMEDIIAQCFEFRSWFPKEFIFEGNDRKELKIVLEIKKRRRKND